MQESLQLALQSVPAVHVQAAPWHAHPTPVHWGGWPVPPRPLPPPPQPTAVNTRTSSTRTAPLGRAALTTLRTLATAASAAGTLAPPTIAYPPDGVLLPPNMDVLEVQFGPGSDAKLFEVDFTNTRTRVAVETTCVPVPDVRGGPSRGCGITLPLAAWKD